MAQVVKLEPGDVLILANLGDSFADDDSLRGLGETLREMGIARILCFEGDVDLSKATEDALARA